MTPTPQNTSNSGSELDNILDDALNTIQAYVQDEIQDDNGYPPFYGDGETFERVKSEAIAAINRLYIKRSDVVEAVESIANQVMRDLYERHDALAKGWVEPVYGKKIHIGDKCQTCMTNFAGLRNDLKVVIPSAILTKLGLSGEQEGK